MSVAWHATAQTTDDAGQQSRGIKLLSAQERADLPTPTLTGTYAVPDGQPKVAATLTATPKVGGQAGTQVLDVTMTRLGTNQPIMRYETELSKQLHLIAVSGDLRTFVHEHAGKPEGHGQFRVPMAFPHAGLWHVYADAVPAGLGQQVMRLTWTWAVRLLVGSRCPCPSRTDWKVLTGATACALTGWICMAGRKRS